MVTGLVDQGEDISAAAEREVFEETGVRATFSAVLAFRQAHGFAFGKSDFFFVIALRWEFCMTCAASCGGIQPTCGFDDSMLLLFMNGLTYSC